MSKYQNKLQTKHHVEERCLERALESLEILKETDMVMAPLAPTDHMMKMGASVGGVGNSIAKHIYETMVASYIFDPSRDEMN